MNYFFSLSPLGFPFSHIIFPQPPA